MLRIIISLALIFAVVWYMLKDGDEKKQVLEQQRQTLETAKTAAQATEEASAAMAKQTDAIRDAILGESDGESGGGSQSPENTH